jgi:hypothetical protein
VAATMGMAAGFGAAATVVQVITSGGQAAVLHKLGFLPVAGRGKRENGCSARVGSALPITGQE